MKHTATFTWGTMAVEADQDREVLMLVVLHRDNGVTFGLNKEEAMHLVSMLKLAIAQIDQD